MKQALRQRQKSIAFSDVSAESIAKAGSGDEGALKKVVGASVVGGKYVYVRGLGDRYSCTPKWIRVAKCRSR